MFINGGFSSNRHVSFRGGGGILRKSGHRTIFPKGMLQGLPNTKATEFGVFYGTGRQKWRDEIGLGKK